MTKRYNAYPEYKESGVEWLEEIPEHWFSTQIRYGFDIALGKMLTKEPKNNSYQLKSYLKAINIQPSGVDVSSVEKMWFSPSELINLRLEKNDLLISEGGDVGRAAIWSDELSECYIQNAINRARPLKANLSKFLFYWMYSLKHSDFINIICNKATIAHYTAEKVEASPLFLPTSKEQQKIANFLDHEAAKIDTLIAKQEKLIALLKEKRQAVISHAVTRGLNSNVPMKDSGVEWLGEVPEYWGVKKLKFCSTLLSQKEKINVQTVIALENIEGFTGKFISTNSKYSGEDVLFNKGDILFGKLRPYLAKVFLCDNTGIAFGDILAFRPNNQASSSFLFYTMISEWFIEIVNSSTYGSKMPRASSDFINEMEIAFPPIDEQIKIAQELDTMLGKFEILTKKAVAAIELMKERKTTLISAAVTGKIDVRNWQEM